MVAQVDLTSVTYFLPIISFLLVFIVSFAFFKQTQVLGESPWVQIFTSLFISSIFVSAGGSVKYVQNVVPWFAVLLLSFFMVFALAGFIGAKDTWGKNLGMVFIIIAFLVFIISAVIVYSSYIIPYLPGNLGFYEGDETTINFLDWLYSPRVAGAVLLLAISALVSWVLVKKG